MKQIAGQADIVDLVNAVNQAELTLYTVVAVRDKVIQAFKRYKTPLHMDIELPTLQAIKRFVAMGNGVALVPEISVENEIARGDLVRIPVRELHLTRKLRLIYRRDASLSHAARAFFKVAEAMALERRERYRFQREA